MATQPPERPGCRPARGRKPLPDPAAVRLCLIPDPAPPYDGEEAGPVPQQGQAAPGTAQSSRRAEPPRPQAAARPQATAPAWPSRFAQVLAETLAGSRPPRQIAPWTTERARDSIRRLGPQLSSAQRPRVRRVIMCRPSSHALEMTVVVSLGPRVRALAVRLERDPPGAAAPGSAGWRCTAVEAA